MSFYEIVLFVHIAAVVVWLGSGFLVHLLAHRADKAQDVQRLQIVLADMSALANVLFIPASLTVLAAGVVLVVDGPWGFDQLWVLIALGGFLATFLTGALVLGPAGEKIAAVIARDGGMSPDALGHTRRLFAIARVDYVVLVVILMDMVLKPSADDPAALLLMAAVLVGGTAYFLSQARSASAQEPAGPILTA